MELLNPIPKSDSSSGSSTPTTVKSTPRIAPSSRRRIPLEHLLLGYIRKHADVLVFLRGSKESALYHFAPANVIHFGLEARTMAE